MELLVPDFKIEREKMVREQLASRNISDAAVLDAFRKVPREFFVPPSEYEEAYHDHPLPIGYHQTISQPYMVALMTQNLSVSATDRVLEIGTGSGYQTAILAELAREVYTVERIEPLSASAREVLGDLGYSNIHFLNGDGSLGWEEFAPFDRIIVTAGSPQVPQSLVEELEDGGRMLIPVGEAGRQNLRCIEKNDNRISERIICGCVFVKLIGQEGWKE